MKQIMSVLVENHSGVLARIAGLFARRGFNIVSLAVGETMDPTASRMTIVVDGDAQMIEQVEKHLNKQVDVVKVRTLETEASTRRELTLVKVNATPQIRWQISDIVAIMKAEIIDLSPTTMTVMIADRPDKVQQLMTMLEPYGIVDIARTGTIALPKGAG